MKTYILLLCIVGGVSTQNAFVCPSDWITYDDRCYHFVFYPQLSYGEAAKACQRDGAILLSVETLQEHSFLSGRLRTTDVQRHQWYTSGERDPSFISNRFVWTATNTEIPKNSPIWLSQFETIQSDVTKNIVAYKFDTVKGTYGLGVIGSRHEPRPYICEISTDEVYRINLIGRGFDYGVPYANVGQIKKGPKFTVEAKDTVIVSDGVVPVVYLECIATGVPQPEYQWLRNNLQEVITTTLDSRYTITNGRLTIQLPEDKKDAGVYQCRVSNSEGVIISAPAQLSFASLDEFSNVQTGKVEPDEYQGAAIECPKITARLSTAITYQWMKSDSDIFAPGGGPASTEFVRPELNNHMFVSGNGKLYFSEVTNNGDKGFYFCVATLATLNQDMNYAGASQPPIRTSKGIELAPRTSSGGNYAPRIQDSFINVVPGSPIRGMNISLECFAYGTTPLQYSWEYPHWDYERYSLVDSNRVLRINNVQLEDSGLYACKVVRENKAADFDRKEYTFTVEAAPEMVLPLQDQHLDLGTRQLTWRCEARSVPFPHYTWYKNGVPLTDNAGNPDITVHRNTLILRNLDQARDEGMYQCMANNTHGEASSAAQLRILFFAPTFSKYPMSPTMMGAVGGNITIPCRPEAAPFPLIQWFFGGTEMRPSTDSDARVHMMLNGDLAIGDLNTGDQGYFECRASNEFGEDSNRTYVTIQARTVLTRVPGPAKVLVNSTAFMYCTASYNQHDRDITYQWAFNGKILDIDNDQHYRQGTPPDNEGGLYIVFAQFEHQGVYTCIAKTQIDEASASAYLQVLGPPEAPAGLAALNPNLVGIQLADEREVVLRWTDPIDSHGSPIHGYIVYGKTNYSQTWTVLEPYVNHQQTIQPGGQDLQRRQYLLQNLKPGVSYQFKISAINAYGYGEESNPTGETVIPGSVPYKAPDNVGGGGGKVGTLRITWDPLSPEDAGWGIGYTVEWRKKPAPGETPGNLKWNKDTVTGNVREYSTLVGDQLFYMPYNVRITPFNIHGGGPPAENDTVYSAEAMPIGVPGNVYAEPFNESAMFVYWEPVPDTRETMKGRLKGYKIFYWLKDEETQEDARQAIIYGNTDHALIIGLQPDTWYTVSVIVFNNAGNSLKSEVAHQSTDRSAPLEYPVNIEVYPGEAGSVRVKFRGVSTGILEEPLLGYKIRYWRDTEDIRQAQDVDCEKNTEGVLYQIQPDHLYHLRVLGYSVGGDGKMSSPETLFSYMGGRVLQIQVDPLTSNMVYVFRDSAASPRCSSTLVMLVGVLTVILMS